MDDKQEKGCTFLELLTSRDSNRVVCGVLSKLDGDSCAYTVCGKSIFCDSELAIADDSEDTSFDENATKFAL